MFYPFACDGLFSILFHSSFIISLNSLRFISWHTVKSHLLLEKSCVEGTERRQLPRTHKSRVRLGSGRNSEACRGKTPQGLTDHIKDFGLYAKNNRKTPKDCEDGHGIIRFALQYIIHALYLVFLTFSFS